MIGIFCYKFCEIAHLWNQIRFHLDQIFHFFPCNSKWSNTVVAIASKCTELQWAHECLEKFQLEESSNNLKSVFHPDLMEIYWDNKQRHLKVIAEKSGIQLEDMIFFDNQMDNCRDVSVLKQKRVPHQSCSLILERFGNWRISFLNFLFKQAEGNCFWTAKILNCFEVLNLAFL